MKSIIVFAFSLSLFVSTALQAQKAVFIFSAPEGQEILKIDDDKHEKSVDFFVSGLNNADEAAALVKKIAAVSGVKTFTISENLIDGQRKASGTFEACNSLDFFRSLLVNAGIEDLIINGEELKSKDLAKVWKSTQGDAEHPNPDPRKKEEVNHK